MSIKRTQLAVLVLCLAMGVLGGCDGVDGRGAAARLPETLDVHDVSGVDSRVVEALRRTLLAQEEEMERWREDSGWALGVWRRPAVRFEGLPLRSGCALGPAPPAHLPRPRAVVPARVRAASLRIDGVEFPVFVVRGEQTSYVCLRTSVDLEQLPGSHTVELVAVDEQGQVWSESCSWDQRAAEQEAPFTYTMW